MNSYLGCLQPGADVCLSTASPDNFAGMAGIGPVQVPAPGLMCLLPALVLLLAVRRGRR